MAKSELLRALPKVDDVLRRPEVAALALPRWAVTEAVRREVERRRRAILDEGAEEVAVAVEDVARLARALVRPSLRRVVNATGVVLHTNLGRAPLAEAAIARVVEVARGYSNLEYDLARRERGSRHVHVQALVAAACGAEAAVVVNNNAAAVLLSLAALAAGREVIVSRGELIEIGGSFRVPDVMRASGARLVEVGTTNKTHLRDYTEAIGAETALLMKVHRSNFAMVGFTEEVDAKELVGLGRDVMIDLGSGTMIDPAGFGLPAEPTVGAAVASGAAVVTFSGDKLLGGPQAGIIVGRTDAVARIKKHPLMRALRPDKLTLAALEATLGLYRDGRERELPTLRMLAMGGEELRARAERLRGMVMSGGHDIGPPTPGTAGGEDVGHENGKPARGLLDVRVLEVTSAVGGGALPTATPSSWALALSAAGRSADEIDAALRASDPPVVGRIADDLVILDVRTIADEELGDVARAVRQVG